MPAFHQLLNAAQPGDIDRLTRNLPGFYRHAKILESLAAGIRSGAVPLPGREEAPRQTAAMTGHRQGALASYVVDLGTIWNATTDEQLAALCREYPGFHSYAELMEEAAEAERRKPARSYDDLPQLPDALKQQLSSLLSTAAGLECDYQSALDASGVPAAVSSLPPLDRIHAEWEADLARFTAALPGAGVPQKSRDMVLPVLERMAQQIARLKARLQAS
jgi:hypothetical protein